MNRVLVVESGAKTRTIKRFLGDDYDVVACGGHIADLPTDELGIDIDDGFDYTLEPINRRRGDAVESIRRKLEDADEVFLATDPDREGEAIAADLREMAVPPGCRVHRIEFNAITYPAVTEALENPRTINETRVEAQRARRSLDRLIGFILSSHATYDPAGPHAPSVGRVQSPAVRLVVDREREREEFDPHYYWTVQARLTIEGDDAFDIDIEGEWDEFDDAKQVALDLIDAGTFTVTSRDVDPSNEQNPLPPYTTDALQNDADYLLDRSPERTMELAQRLYEGVEIGDGDDAETKALITYMRTDSTRVSPSALNLAKEALTKREDLGEEFYKGRTWEVTDGAQDAHEAIRPTHPEDPENWPENLEGKLEGELLELYDLVFKRFLASQMVPAVYRTTSLELVSRSHRATAVGHERLEPGFLKVWREVRPDHGWEDVGLPEADSGDEFPVDRAWPNLQETRPPTRYREGSLVSALKERGIGRPSTYGTILTKIKRARGGYGYTRKVGKTLQPTEKGSSLVEYLEERFPSVVDYDYTAEMETDLDRIETGEVSYRVFLERTFEWLEEPYEKALEKGWIDSDRPTPAQLAFLADLVEETGIEPPPEVYESKSLVSEWIEKLKESIDPHLTLGDITEADVDGVDVHRFRLYYTPPLPDEEYEFIKELGMKYVEGNADHAPAWQFQRKDRSVVEDVRDELRDRYESGTVLDEFVFKCSGEY